MFNELDKFISYDTTTDYWYDAGFVYAQEILADFSYGDWKELSDVILSKSADYQKKLVYCFDGTDEFHELKIIEKLISVDDDELFIMCVDSMRNFSDGKLKKLIDKIKAKSDVPDGLSKIVIEEFFKEYKKTMDITGYIINSECYSGNEFNEILNYIKINYDMNYIDYESGEDWAIISDGQGKIFMLHAKIKIMFTSVKDFPEKFHDMNILYFNEYSEKLWSIDTSNLPPEFCWYTSAIDRDFFSTEDLYYATH